MLGPLQNVLGAALVPTRAAHRVLSWRDASHATLLYLLLLLQALILALIPWATVVAWSVRVVGLAILGPHMYYVGLLVEKRAAEPPPPPQPPPAAASAPRLGTHALSLLPSSRFVTRKPCLPDASGSSAKPATHTM